VSYDKLEQVNDPKILNKLAVLKVNGGLGTSMGMHIVTSYQHENVLIAFQCRYDWCEERS
jgi:hypothetical protein